MGGLQSLPGPPWKTRIDQLTQPKQIPYANSGFCELLVCATCIYEMCLSATIARGSKGRLTRRRRVGKRKGRRRRGGNARSLVGSMVVVETSPAAAVRKAVPRRRREIANARSGGWHHRSSSTASRAGDEVLHGCHGQGPARRSGRKTIQRTASTRHFVQLLLLGEFAGVALLNEAMHGRRRWSRRRPVKW